MRNRIAAVSFCPDGDSLHPESATHYSYDIHGNVRQLVQDIPVLNPLGRRFTKLDYEYDLISGNVNRVWFQKGQAEQFGHRYRYDADNRITHVYTDNIFKKKGFLFISQERLEARYFYLPHGALARVELGHKQIQGIDYAYTLQGWLKDINGYRSSQYDVFNEAGNFDIGGDGYFQAGNPNRLFAHDGFASSIQYYPNDYRPVAGGNYFNDPSSSAVALYNGNISALTTSYYHLMMPSLLKTFRYDKLNRIKQMQTATHSYDATGWEPVSDNFSTEYTYDWNGNLLSLHRKDQTGTLMHHISYNYMDTTKNRLTGISATGLLSSTYQYDALGNLVRDNAESLTMGWNAMGKVDTIRRNGNILSTFRYSPTGQRQVKATGSDTIYYIHDATGNVMCVYRLKNDTLTVMERYIYGSKRLGMLGQQVWITAGGAARLQDTCTIGHRTYELTDHLGNVTFTLPDRKWLTYNADNELIYVPNAVTYTDYYPFGFPMPRPGFTMGGYRYSFNGQEADNEVYGTDIFQNYGFRMYDTRLARFWGVDPLTKDYPMLTPFQFASCSPIWAVDWDGLEAKIAIAGAGGANTHYSKSDINAFMARAIMLKDKGFDNAQVYNGMSLIEALKDATSKEGSILKIVSFAHSGAIGIFLDNNEGFYTSSMSQPTDHYANVDMLVGEVSKGTVKFELNATWVFASCYAANKYDNRLENPNESLAEYAAKSLHITTVGSTGSVYPEVIRGKETGKLKTDGVFKKFEPYDVSVTRIIKEQHSFLFFKWTTSKKVTTTETKVKETNLGKTIDPSAY